MTDTIKQIEGKIKTWEGLGFNHGHEVYQKLGYMLQDDIGTIKAALSALQKIASGEDVPKEYQISDDQLNDVWGNANFGGTPKRKVILDTLLQTAGGYSTGHTALCICQELGLIGSNKIKPILTKRGKRVMYHWNKNRCADRVAMLLEREMNDGTC